eukprot:Phypoly_transcript_03891.p1 GENE.Phypoly_transcript_03891~~Phypoly_transcript_03891.p1  ORF type:complete len:679 (+),score=149.56 Phypoly_transcript_03891:32-2038(+)
MNRKPAPTPPPSLSESILSAQLRHAEPSENGNNNNNDGPAGHVHNHAPANDVIVTKQNSWALFGGMGELGAVLRKKGAKAASDRGDQIKQVKEKLEERRFGSFEEARKFVQEAIDLQSNLATVNEDILVQSGWPTFQIEELALMTTAISSTQTGVAGVEKGLKNLSALDNFSRLEGFFGILFQGKRELINLMPNITTLGIPLPFELQENLIRLILVVLLKIYESGFRKYERLDKTLSRFDLQYTVRSTDNYLHTARRFTNQFHALVVNEPDPSEDISKLLEKVQSFSDKAKEILEKLAAEFNLESPTKPNQADEIQGDPNQFRNFASKDSSKPAAQSGSAKKIENLVVAAREGDLERVKTLIKEGQKIDQEDTTGQTPLLAAISKGKTEVALHLISSGANVNKAHRGNSPLLLACEGSCGISVVKALLEKSAKTNEKNAKSETPLHVAARCLKRDIMKLLIQNKADISAKDNVGRNPLQVLALKGDYNVTITAPPQAPLGIELARFLETGEFSDISFLVGGEVFKAHKLILCAQCPPFRSMLESNWREKQFSEIPLEDISKNAFRHFLCWVYTNDASFPPDDVALVLELLVLADKYFVHSLKRKCEAILATKLTHENVIAVYSYAKALSPAVLGKVCTKFFLDRYSALRGAEGSEELLEEILDGADGK